MQPAEFLASLRRDGTRLVEVVDGRLDVGVPGCPDWTMADLVFHTGSVMLFWADVVDQAKENAGRGEVSRPDDADLVAWFRDAHEHLIETLEGTDPTLPCWTWGPPHNVGFVMRRMAHEVGVHRWDAECGTGHPDPFEPELAADGIDEYVHYFLDRPGDSDPEPVAGTVHIHCTDVDGEWLVAPEDGAEGKRQRFSVTRGHEKGDAVLRGGASEILLVLWRRVPLDSIQTPGDIAIAEGFVAYAKL